MKLWGGRFSEEEDELMKEFNSSLKIDKRLYNEDIIGSLAHAKMLQNVGLISTEEYKLIEYGLKKILNDIQNQKLKIEGDYEDIHSFVEITLTNLIGEAGKKLHTARSRNDQVALDMRLFTKKNVLIIIEKIEKLILALKNVAEKNPVIMPGYTHLQKAQIVTFKHHLMAYVQMFKRDKKRLQNALEIMDENPLGSGAIAGSTYDIDREFTTKELKFSKPVENFMDGVSDRDYLLEIMADFSIIMMHLSRFSEEIILFNSNEFQFITLSDSYTTGSSIMPHKKNPDAAELTRGKTGRVYGNMIALFTLLKGLPLTYNKDMQEDKESFFDSLDTVEKCIEITTKMVLTLKVNKDKMKKSVQTGFLNATEVADYLVKRGIAFREAHNIVGKLIIYCEENEKSIENLSLEELKQFSNNIKEDIYEYIDYENILKKGIKKEI